MEMQWDKVQPKLSERCQLEIQNAVLVVRIEELEAEASLFRHTVEKLEQAVKESG